MPNISVYKSKKKKSSISLTKSRLDIVKENKAKKVRKIGVNLSFFKKIKSNKLILRVLLVLIGLVFITLTFSGILVLNQLQVWSKDIPNPDQVFPNVPVATKIVDRFEMSGAGKGTELYKIFGNANSDKVDISEIPDVLKAAFMAAEDKTFYNNPGYDPQAILRCSLNLLKKQNQCGASTITQQLIKLTTGQNQSTVERKVKELFLASKIESSNSKDKILEMYLRVTPYGSNIVGVKTAAKFYFGVDDLKKLDLAQSAILAAIVRDPTHSSPTLSSDTKAALKILSDRQSYIFDQLTQNIDLINSQLKKNNGDSNAPNSLTQKMIDDARTEQLTYKSPIATDIKAGHFVNYVIDQLEKRNYKNGTEPFTLDNLQTGGYTVITSLDYSVQKVAENYVSQYGDKFRYLNMHNAAVMTIQPSTGQILSMAGSKNYYGQNEGCDSKGQNCQFNPEVNVLTSLQSPGSTNKPIGYYEAFKEGKLFPGSVLPDIPLKIGSSYEPKNWDGQYTGIRPLRLQLRESRNIPALLVVETIGVDKYLKAASSFGYTTYANGDFGPSVILGGADIIPVEHVQAYGVFANGGDLVQVDPILKIIDKNGLTVYEAKPQRKPVGDPQAVWQINQTLFRLDTLGAPTYWDDREMAAKTGTTENNKDALIMMYSPDFVTLGWAGNNNNDPLDQNRGWPATVVVPWVKKYMQDISKTPYLSAKTKFTRPGFVYQGGGDCNDQGQCLGMERGWLIQGREPARGDLQQKKAVVCTDQPDHLARPIDITMGLSVEKTFSYVKFSPSVPGFDVQKSLDDYIGHHDITNGGPQAPCDINRTGGVNGPFFKLNPITVNGSKSSATIHVSGGVFTSSGTITAASFYIDNKLMSGCVTNTFNSFDVTCTDIGGFNLDDGLYPFKAVATDSLGISNSLTINKVQVGAVNNSNFNFTNIPAGPFKYAVDIGSGKTYNLNVKYSFANPNISNVQLCELRNGATTPTICYTMSGSGGNFNYVWGATIPDSLINYSFYVTASSPSGLGSFISNISNTISVLP